jgi:flavin reductase (DIM6/NTAB) family NADH-FMN oxidoreductase RutF
VTATVAPPDAVAMREAMGRFATGVTVVTTVDADGRPAGCTISAFCSLSLDPPLVLVCVGRGRRMHALLAAAPGFAVNVLAAHQRDVATAFARTPHDRFAGLATRPGRAGARLLDGAVAHIECDRETVLDGGDHAIVVGLVRAVTTFPGEPLLYARGAFLDLPGPAWDRAAAGAPHEWLLSAPW